MELELKQLCYKKAEEKFKGVIPDKVNDRIQWELQAIYNTHTEFVFLYLYHTVKQLGVKRCQFGYRGMATYIYICYLLGISSVNPFDYNLSPEFALGLEQDKIPDINLDFFSWEESNLIEELATLTGVVPDALTYEEPEIMNLFQMHINSGNVVEEGTFECVSERIRKIIALTNPSGFDDLVKVYAIANGTNTWESNAELLIRDGKVDVSSMISCRDDIFDYLLSKGVDRKNAYDITEHVRKGMWARGITEHTLDDQVLLRDYDIPEWFMWSCNQIKYLSPRAHAIVQVMMNWRVGWYKVYYPKEYEQVMHGRKE